MRNPYSYYYGYSNAATAMVIGVMVAIILGVVLYFTFLSKKNEGKFTGAKEKIYNFLNFNKFYLEEISKLLYAVMTSVVTVLGIILLFVNFPVGFMLLVIGNIVLRITYEAVMMFIVLCRNTVSIDKKLENISNFYGNDFDDCFCGECAEDDASCGSGECGACGECAQSVQAAPEKDTKENFECDETSQGAGEPGGEINASDR